MNARPEPLPPCRRCQPLLASNTVCGQHYDTYELRWKARGFTFDDFLAWQPSIPDPVNAAAYRDAGMSPDDARTWHATGLPAATAVIWRRTGLSPAEVLAWLDVRTVTNVADYRTLSAAAHTADTAGQQCGRKQPFSLSRYVGPGRRGPVPA